MLYSAFETSYMSREIIPREVYRASSLTFYDSFRMIRVGNRLFQATSACSLQWEQCKRTTQCCLETYKGYYFLTFSIWYVPLKLMQHCSARKGTLMFYLVQIQKWWRSVLNRRRILAFAMAFHSRLGESSGVAVIGPDLLEKIGVLALEP